MLNTITKPSWLSSEMYPFESHFFHTPAGRLHYIDEGTGRPLVFVHGNPSWSFEFRLLVKELSKEFRCIAVDHLGFGLSDKNLPSEETHPRRHAERLRALLEDLNLTDITLVLGDWGGPMGLEFAIAHPDRVSGLVLFNTWAWPVADDMHFKMFSWMMASPVGQFWIRYFNIFVNVVFPMSVGVKSVMTSAVMDHYRGPLEKISDRSASASLPYYIVGATAWVEEIWAQRDKFIDKPALVVWGGSDIAFREKEFNVWKETLRNGTFQFHKNVGHVIAEEMPDVTVGYIRDFMAKTKPQPVGKKAVQAGA